MLSIRKHTIAFLLFAALFFSSCHPKLLTGKETAALKVQQDVALDKNLDRMIHPYRLKLASEMDVKIGHSQTELSNRGNGETALGNFVADMQKTFAETYFGYEVDLSVINNGGLRNSLPAGPITIGNIYELSPFDNYLYILELNANDVRKLAEYVIENKNLGINGLQLKSEAGEITFLKLNGDGLQEDKKYKLAINDYLANGGDNMAFLKELPRLETSDQLLRDILIKQIQILNSTGLSINSKIEGRLILN
jgi:2',3'-cyclic-nucleotide 2'-phosphodiesterase (5'-nucleotidase family)